MLEKAYAKLHNSYNKISHGLCHEAMRDITGAPSYELKFTDHKDILDKIFDFKQRNYFMCLETHLIENVD